MTTELTAKLQQLADLANEIGAEGVWLLRGSKDAYLIYSPTDPPALAKDDPFPIIMNIRFDIADTGVLVIMRFPTDDGEPGIESR
jgi:hypothetical protein